ncbi:uncharacterized protein LOC115918618 [Strongylocentrotus purpuratus]|uniref:Uncharacterized protein n=1 Tax=Strongylocentrotus purpuratus TaxID=7668 RepID=A0A7M7NSH6_STRPU|nr:uncharacterized protein LOC115918618 [Strongylocentrotus purpuratus]
MGAVSVCLSPHFAARIMLVLSLFARAMSQNNRIPIPLPPLSLPVLTKPPPVIVTTSTVHVQTTPTTTTTSSTTSEATSTVSTTLTITSTTTNVDVVTSDLMTTDAYITPRKDLNVAAISIGVTLPCFIIAIIVIIIFLRHRCKRKITNTKQTGKTGGGSGDSENNFPDNKYQYNGVSTVENVPRISSNISCEDYSPIGPPNNGTDVVPRVPKQDSVDEYQYSAVGPIQNGVDVTPRVLSQDSVDEYQYTAVGPIQNGAEVYPRVPTQDPDDDDFYAPVGAISSDTLTPKATAFSNVCTDESLYIIPDRSDVNPYQELAVKTSAFAGLQKLRKKPVLEQNTQRAPEIKAAKQPPVKPKKPIRKSQTPTDDTSVQISHLPTEVDNAVYGLKVLGEQNACAASSLADGQTDDQFESIYANADIELREMLPSSTTATINRDSTIHGGIEMTDGENPYENSMIGDQSFLQENEGGDYLALSRKATLPV